MLKDRTAFLDSCSDRITTNGYLSTELLNFYNELFTYQSNQLIWMKSRDVSLKIDSPAEEFPRIRPDEFSLPQEFFEELKNSLKGLAELIKKFQPDIDFSTAVEFLSADDNLSAAIKYLLSHDFPSLSKSAERMKLLSEGYLFLLINLLKPVFVSMRESSPPESGEDDWLEPVCPFCGYLPDFASIHEDEENKLILHCGLCETKWRYKRIICFNCGNSDHEKIQSFVSEIDKKHQVTACDVCKAYIKTFRLPKSSDPSSYDLYVENLVSNYLDATVMEMGYSRP